MAVAEAEGVEVDVVTYMKQPPDRATLASIVAKLEDAFLRASKQPKFQAYLSSLGEVPASTRGPALARELRKEYDELGALTKQVAPK